MTVDLTPDQCEEIFHAALKAGDVRGAEAALRLLVAVDPHRAGTLFDVTRFALEVARAGAHINEEQT